MHDVLQADLSPKYVLHGFPYLVKSGMRTFQETFGEHTAYRLMKYFSAVAETY